MNDFIQNTGTRHSQWLRIFLDAIKERGIPTHVEHDEGYKFKSVNTFQTYFDIEATDLAGNLDQAIETNNLVVGAMYFPKKMLLIYALQYPNETREILRNLFDESKDIIERINHTKTAFENLEIKRAKVENHKPYNTYIGLRFISLLLGFYGPNKYNALKPSEWKVFARFMNADFGIANKTSAGEQYRIYTEYINSLRDFVSNRPEIIEIKNALTDGLEFKDDEFRWMTQDVIFVTARAYADKKANEQDDKKEDYDAKPKAVQPSGIAFDENDTGFMAYEEHLEEYVIKNWGNIDFGEELTMYIEDDGTTGQQYTTDVGILDILAKDKSGNFVVIELKRADSGYKVVGQTLNYIGWVQENLATNGEKVRGLIIVGKADKQLLMAVRPVSEMINLKEYRVHMQLKDPE